MCKIKSYRINNEYKSGSELTYDDVYCLYKEFYTMHGKYPTEKYQKVEYNVPHSKIVARVLHEKGITLNDFQNSFGVVRIRSDPKNYDKYVEKFKELYIKNGQIQTTDLLNNNLGLPAPKFFIKYCPDKNVKNYVDFIKWCGFKHTKIKDKEDIVNALLNYEAKIKRPIVQDDITVSKIGFSEIVIKRIWGSFSNCKKELGLLETERSKETISFEDYLEQIKARLNEIKNIKSRVIIGWSDLESHNEEFKTKPIEHHTAERKFKDKGVDFCEYIKSLGFSFDPYSYGFVFSMPDGEMCRSKFEYDYSTFLKKYGLRYNIDYYRDVMYKTFCSNMDMKSKINCDYKITYNNKNYYIEIAGIMQSEDDFEKVFANSVNNDYRNKMILKRQILENAKINYLFLYKKDMDDGSYKEKTLALINK